MFEMSCLYSGYSAYAVAMPRLTFCLVNILIFCEFGEGILAVHVVPSSVNE